MFILCLKTRKSNSWVPQLLRSYKLKSTKYCEWRSQSSLGNGRPKKFRLTGNSAAFNAVSDKWKRTGLLSECWLLLPREVTHRDRSCALPSAHLSSRSRRAEHTELQSCQDLASPPGVNPCPALGAAAPAPSSALLTNSTPKSSLPPSTAEDFALWTLISLWNEAQASSTKQGPPHWLELQEKHRRQVQQEFMLIWEGESQAFFTTLASSGICLLTKKKSKSLLIAVSSYSNVFQKKVTMALGMYMPEGQMERQGKD